MAAASNCFKLKEEKRKTYRELRANERGQVKVPEPRMKAGNGGDGHGIVGAEIGETNLSFAHVRHLGINFSSEKKSVLGGISSSD